MKKIIKIIFLMTIFTVLIQVQHEAKASSLQQQRLSDDQLFHDVFLTLLKPRIDERISHYYANYLNKKVVVPVNHIHILYAKRIGGPQSFDFLVSAKVTAFIWPGLTAGEDELIYKITSSDIKLIALHHLKSDRLPEQFQYLIEKHSL